jgi:hypothetical protein
MLTVNLDEIDGIAILEPDGELSKTDFISAAKIVDPYIEKSGKLNGIIIHVKSFPGWDSFSALLTHLSFVKDHHKKVAYVAFVTDSYLGKLAENVANHFISAQIKSYPFSEIKAAKEWIMDNIGAE